MKENSKEEEKKMLDFGFYNMDCMEGMKEFPDKYFDLAIVDPPYGDGGGYLAERNEIRGEIPQVHQSTSSTMPESGQPIHGGRWGGGVSRTGGTWATKFGKKLLRGMLRLERTTSKSFSASHAIR